MRRSIPAVLVAICAAAALTACGSSGSSTAASGATDPASAKDTVVFWDTSDPTAALGPLYNKSAFAAAGITAAPTIWAQMKADALAVRAKTGKPAIFLDDAGHYFPPFPYGEGGDMVDTSAKKVTVDDAAGVKAMGIVRDLISSGAAVTDTSSNAYTNMQNAFKDMANLGIAPVPAKVLDNGVDSGWTAG